MPTVKDTQYGTKTFVNINTGKQETVTLSEKTAPSQIKGLVSKGAPTAWFEDDRDGEKDSLKNIAEKGRSDRRRVIKKKLVKVGLVISKKTKAAREAKPEAKKAPEKNPKAAKK